MMDVAIETVKSADIFIIIGTSLNVYPAASLIHYTSNLCEKYIIDPNADDYQGINVIRKKASESVPILVDQLISQNQ